MKKIFTFLLTAALLLSLAGCRQDPQATTPVVTPGPTQSGSDGLSVSIDRLDPEEGTLVVKWSNQTPYEALYGSSFSIERLEGEKWVSCQICEHLVFDLVGYPLQAGQTLDRSYRLTGIFDVSSPGTYRFLTTCFLYDKGYYTTEYTLTAEFAVGDRLPLPVEPSRQPQWRAQYIRTNGSQENGVFPRPQVIDSLQQLQEYYATYREIFDLERKEKVYSDTIPGFLDACDAYDAAFFEENYLVFVLLEEGSGSVRHEVQRVERTKDNKLSVSIDRKVPEVGTSDMAQWHIILEIGRNTPVPTEKDILLYVDGDVFWDGSPQYPVMPIADTFKKPLQGTLITPEGEFTLTTGGYHWSCRTDDGLMQATVADQAGRPLPESSVTPVLLSSKYAETVYAPIPGREGYAPTNSLGYLVKLHWAAEPSSVTFTCWPDTVWQKANTPEEAVVSLDSHSFYAKPGSYIYELTACWEDVGLGYYGEVTYYIYIIG